MTPQTDIAPQPNDEQLISYARPSVERVRAHAFSLVHKLEDAGCITDDEARTWRENLEMEFESK